MINALCREFEYNLWGYLLGKSVMRDFLVERFDLSEAEAERSLDEWESLGWVQFEGDPTKASHRGSIWRFRHFQQLDTN